jgi:hypothetical protein
MEETRVADPAWVPPLLWVGFPVLGAGLGLLLKVISEWVASLSWAPLQGPFELVASVREPYAWIGALIIGGLAGLAFAYLAAKDSFAVTVSVERVGLDRGGTVCRVPRDGVTSVFLDGKQLVLLGPVTEELAREKSDLPAAGLRDAFVAHGYPWREDGDPHRADFRRWVEDMPGLPEGADALLKARAAALAKRDGADAAELRAELARLGVVVRDQKKRQFFRTYADG